MVKIKNKIMVVGFFAEIVNTHEEDGVFTLGFSENADFDKYLTIQYQITPLTEKEIKLGWTQYYLSLIPHGLECYDAISSVLLKKEEVQFNLKPKDDNCGIMSIVISFSQQHTSMIELSLKRIFDTEILL